MNGGCYCYYHNPLPFAWGPLLTPAHPHSSSPSLTSPPPQLTSAAPQVSTKGPFGKLLPSSMSFSSSAGEDCSCKHCFQLWPSTRTTLPFPGLSSHPRWNQGRLGRDFTLPLPILIQSPLCPLSILWEWAVCHLTIRSLGLTASASLWAEAQPWELTLLFSLTNETLFLLCV